VRHTLHSTGSYSHPSSLIRARPVGGAQLTSEVGKLIDSLHLLPVYSDGLSWRSSTHVLDLGYKNNKIIQLTVKRGHKKKLGQNAVSFIVVSINTYREISAPLCCCMAKVANTESSEVFDIIKPGRRVKINSHRQ